MLSLQAVGVALVEVEVEVQLLCIWSSCAGDGELQTAATGASRNSPAIDGCRPEGQGDF